MVNSSVISITPSTHAGSHVIGGADPLINPLLLHHTRHEVGGDDEMTVPAPFTTMSDEIAGRANNTNYRNTSGNTMKVVVRGTIGGAVDFLGYVKATTPADTVVYSEYNPGVGGTVTIELIVPDDYYYRVSGNWTINSWFEYV